MWFVPLGPVLDAHGLNAIKAYAFAANGLAAFVSPLIFGAMADRHTSPVKVCCGGSLGTAAAMALASTAIKPGLESMAHPRLGFNLRALCSSPTWSISSTIVLRGWRTRRRSSVPSRAMATIGWVAGCLIVSALNFDGTPFAGYGGTVARLLVVVFTYFLPALETPRAVETMTGANASGSMRCDC